MESPTLKVRCLASTSVREQTLEEVDHVKRQDEERTASCEANGDVEDSAKDEESGREVNEDDRGGVDNLSDLDDYTSSSSSGVSSSRSSSINPQGASQKFYTSCVQEAQLSPDGTCIFTSDYSRTFSVYPIDLNLHSTEPPRPLKPYAQFICANPIWTFAVNPLFHFQDPFSTNVLVSSRDSYINLHNALWDISRTFCDGGDALLPSSNPINISRPITSYKLIDHLTEAVTAPHSFAYAHDGAHFFAGGQNMIATFDMTHTSDPIHIIPTIPSKRNRLKGGGRGFKGCISALSLSPPLSSHASLLAGGSRTRFIGIYDSISGSEVTHFSLPGSMFGHKLRASKLPGAIGDGVTQLKWSPDGQYLYVAERQSDVLLIYDVRNFALALGYCAGRKACTKQKLGFDVWSAGADGHELWAGGTDGVVRVWRNACLKEGPVEPDEEVRVEDRRTSVVGALVHKGGGYIVAAKGMIEVGEEARKYGTLRGGGVRPRYSEWGSVDIFGLN